jgi:reverse gyrase
MLLKFLILRGGFYIGRRPIPVLKAKFLGLCPGCDEDLYTYAESCKCTLSSDLMEDLRRAEEFMEFFRKCTGFEASEIQKVWARRLVRGESFAAIAPTGTGKTVLGIVSSLFFARNSKSYLIFPTLLLVNQAEDLSKKFSERAGLNLEILSYISGRRDLLDSISKGEFDVLITTNQFLARNFDLIKDKKFGFVFVDDVDSMMKASRNLEKVLLLLGFSQEEIREKIPAEGEKGVIFMASATGKAGKKTLLLRYLLNFDVGAIREGKLRNVVDISVNKKETGSLIDIIRKMGRKGGLIFLRRMEEAERVAELLEKEGISAEIARGSDPDMLERFRKGETDVLIGAAKPYGVLVRGIDIPEVRYTVFYGAPMYEISISNLEEISPGVLSIALASLSGILGKEALVLSRQLKLNPDEEKIRRAKEILSDFLSSSPKIENVLFRDGEAFLCIPDMLTYIQGSGRSSRLRPGGLTKGASFLMEDELLDFFVRRASAYDIDFVDIGSVDLSSLRKEIDEDRARKKEEKKEILRHILFIVESPNKARTISKFFGKPSRRYYDGAVVYETSTGTEVLTIVATLGHLVDLTTKEGFHGVLCEGDEFIPVYTTIKRCRKCGHQFTDLQACPLCGSSDIADSRSTINLILRLAAESERVLIGTDPDTEGEKIAWDLYQMISRIKGNIKRAEFHEVTKKAIMKAIAESKDIDENRVKAQVIRRIEDRWIGFELSQEVQKKFRRKNLSAGRAQTPVLGWIIDRTNEHKKKTKFTVISGDDFVISVEGEVIDEGRFKAFVSTVSESLETIAPPPPFSTGELLKEANRMFKMSSDLVMQIAQDLFETGLITYHRTDSIRVSDAGLRVAEQFLRENFRPRVWSSEGAHECIRPTRPLTSSDIIQLSREGVIQVKLSRDHLRIYDLIFNRFMASQAREAKFVKRKYVIRIEGREFEEERYTSVVDPGWTDYYKVIKIRKQLPEEMEVEVRHIRKPKVPLYSQGDIVSIMKEKKIGRPSTYSTIIGKILMRGYAVERNGKLYSTSLGEKVHSYLVNNYKELVDEQRTALLEKKMDEVESGNMDYQQLLKELFHEIRNRKSSK